MDMRLYKRGKFYYIEVARNRPKSLGVTDKKEAERLFKIIKKRQLEKKLLILDSKDRVSISEFIDIYVNDPDRRNLSEKTHENDKLAFRSLMDVIGDIPIKLIDRDKIKEFKDSALKRMKPVSVNTYLRHIKAGLSWAVSEKYANKVPQMKKIKLGESLPRYIEKSDIDKILGYSKKYYPEMHRIITFAMYTGCRRAEIINARYEHITDGNIRVYGKGKKERIIPLLPQALDVQQDIGKIFRYKHVSTVSNTFRKIVRICGIQARFHDLRHTAATQMLESGIDIMTVKEMLGHVDLRTTEVYAKVLAKTMRKEMLKLSYE